MTTDTRELGARHDHSTARRSVTGDALIRPVAIARASFHPWGRRASRLAVRRRKPAIQVPFRREPVGRQQVIAALPNWPSLQAQATVGKSGCRARCRDAIRAPAQTPRRTSARRARRGSAARIHAAGSGFVVLHRVSRLVEGVGETDRAGLRLPPRAARLRPGPRAERARVMPSAALGQRVPASAACAASVPRPAYARSGLARSASSTCGGATPVVSA